MAEARALRDGFGEGVVLAAQASSSVVALCTDLTESNRLDRFQALFPERFIEVGVAEQNLVGVAAGMARVGKVPFAAGFAAFSPGRSWDQVRSVCYGRLNVKLYGGHAGLSTGEDGATHQALEDIALMRVLPHMTVIVPADAIEMRKAVVAAAEFAGPVYLRGGRPKVPLVTRENDPFVIGQARVLHRGGDVTIVACGLMVARALEASRLLRQGGVQAEVINCHTVKPLDSRTILRSARKTGAVVVAEEHQILGGLGSAVAELLGEELPVPLARVGVRDVFGESGTWTALLEKYGLTAEGIVAAVERVRRARPSSF